MIKVFLVEDEYVIREGIKKNIDWQAHGYEFCGEAGDGELAFPMIQEIRPDIVITDIRMPFMDGLALSRLIKKEFPETEIIILSGYEEFEYAKEGIKIGVAQYLLKPISGDALIKEIDLVAASIVERKQKERIRERYFKQSMDRESEKDNLNIQELDYKQFEKSKLQEFMKVGCKEEVPYFIDEMFQKLDHSAVKSRIFRQYIVMDAYFCVAEFVEEIGLSRDEVEPMDVASDVLSSIEYSKEYIVRIIQKAIDELPDGGVLFLQDGTYPLAGRIVFKENMTFKLSDNAILLNCSQDKNPMMAYNHPYKHNKAEGNSNIIIEGGIWDMNGQLDESGTPKNLPNAESINALGIGYGSNITIRNITFRDCYNGHVIQVAGSDNVLIENCRFEGQSFRGSGDKTRELLQIEPGTVKGYPYTLVQNKAPSTNVTIRNCYFGGSENTPHYMAAIGTHSQQAGVKCSDIVIEDCTFDNAAYTAIHFMAYDRITIRNNIFTITSDSEQIDRYGILADTYGSFIDPTGAESTTDFTIEGNTFDVSDPKATVLEITTNNKSPKHIKNVIIKGNTLKGVNGGKAIDLYLLDNCTISGNTIEGFDRPIVANSCDEQFISDTDVVTE